MAPTPERLEAIRNQMNALKELKDLNMGFDQFIGEYARYMAQMDIDKEALIKAGMSSELMAMFNDYHYVLTNEHALRLIHEGTGSTALVEFDKRYPTSCLYHDSLRTVIQFIRDEYPNDAVAAAYKKIIKGTGTQAKLNDIISFAALIEQHLDLAADIKPGGIEVNKEYLDMVVNDTYEMLKLYAKSQSTAPDRSIHVDAQNRLITLCMKAETKLKNYARAAFVTDKEYYNEHYVNHVNRDKYRSDRREAEQELEEEVLS